MEKYETQNLYVVRPSVCISDETRTIKHNIKRDQILYEHVVQFQNNSKDIDIATHTKYNFVYNSLFNDTRYFEGMGYHCVEGDYNVGIYKGDVMLLVKYLYIMSVSNPEWTKELEKYMISLKPYYDYNELSNIYEQIKGVEDRIMTKTLKNKYIV